MVILLARDLFGSGFAAMLVQAVQLLETRIKEESTWTSEAAKPLSYQKGLRPDTQS
jgi:hypothetical protein